MKHAEVHEHVSKNGPGLGEERVEVWWQNEIIINNRPVFSFRKIRHPVDHINELEKNKHYGNERDQIDEMIRFEAEE